MSSRRIISVTTMTPTATADTANLVSGTYPWFIQGGSSTQLNKIWEVSISGQAASSSSPTFMILSRDTTVGVNTSSGTTVDTFIDASFQAYGTAPLTGQVAATNPQRSVSAHLLNMSLNAFGGVQFWRANRLEECMVVLGNTQPLGELSLSAFTGGTPGAIGAHMIYETILWFGIAVTSACAAAISLFPVSVS